MYETNTIDEEWVEHCNDDELVDAIWVPSAFNVDTFAASGAHACNEIAH